MAYKKIEQNFSFADIAIQNHSDKNRTYIFLNQIEKTIDWNPIENLFINTTQSANPRKVNEHILRFFFSNAFSFKNGFKSILIQNLKARSMTAFHLNLSLLYHWISLPPIIQLFHDSAAACRKKP